MTEASQSILNCLGAADRRNWRWMVLVAHADADARNMDSSFYVCDVPKIINSI